MRYLALALMLFGLISLGGGARAGDSKLGPLTISAPWARATVTQTGGAYLSIANAGSAADKLVGASSDVARRTEVHEETMQNGVMSMAPVPELEIPAGGKVTFMPGGYHVMLIGLKAPLKEGQHFPLTLTFEHAGKVNVDVVVEKAGAMGPGGMHDMPAGEHTNMKM